MTTKRLIVNADDYGANVKRTTGIVAAFKKGIVSSVSVLANGDGWGFAPFRNDPRLGATAGLHFNLSEGAPVFAGHRTLVADDRRFFGKEETRRTLLAGDFDPAEVEKELIAQLQVLFKQRIRVSHIDGHQHVHVYPKVAEVVAKIAREAEIRFVRVPSGPGLEDLGELPARAAETFRKAGLRATDHFRGGHMVFAPSEEKLHETLASLPAGTTELMVHPGHSGPDVTGPFAKFSTPDREVELAALTSLATREVLSRHRIELISFAEL